LLPRLVEGVLDDAGDLLGGSGALAERAFRDGVVGAEVQQANFVRAELVLEGAEGDGESLRFTDGDGRVRLRGLIALTLTG
jgi:hypothetical protein